MSSCCTSSHFCVFFFFPTCIHHFFSCVESVFLYTKQAFPVIAASFLFCCIFPIVRLLLLRDMSVFFFFFYCRICFRQGKEKKKEARYIYFLADNEPKQIQQSILFAPPQSTYISTTICSREQIAIRAPQRWRQSRHAEVKRLR